MTATDLQTLTHQRNNQTKNFTKPKMKVHIVIRQEEHDDYIEKVFYAGCNAQKYADEINKNKDDYPRRVETYDVEDMK